MTMDTAWSKAREKVWDAAFNRREGVELDAKETRALWDSVLADCAEKLANRDRAEAAEDRVAELEKELEGTFATGAAVVNELAAVRRELAVAKCGLAEFAKEQMHLIAQVRELESALKFANDTNQFLLDRKAETVQTLRKELALADLRLAEYGYMVDGSVAKWELDAAADHARKFTDNLGERYRREQA